MASVRSLFSELGARYIPSDSLEAIHFDKIFYDSRQVAKGGIFFCIPGEKTDGNVFIAEAINRGAVAIVTEKEQKNLAVPQLIVPDIRLALGLVSDTLYGQPSRKLRLIGVTGTNGKTTTTHLIEHILNKAGRTAGLIGTLGARYPGYDGYSEAKHTTPQAPELQLLLADMVKAGCSHAAMEVSSHSLELKRVAGCQFSVACLSNITQDHLDFHKTMENYWRAKRLLFQSLSNSVQRAKIAVINHDEKLAPEFLKVLDNSVKLLTYGFSKDADLRVVAHEHSSGMSKIKLASPFGQIDLETQLVGKFNIYNLMAAATVCLAEGLSIRDLANSLSEFSGVSGRFEVVTSSAGKEPLCIVDYAHTPDGLDNVLKTAADLKNKNSKLIVVFGCGGDRDASKRPQMGEIAENRADVVIVTSDNPRSENPQEIIANILTGIKRMKNVEVEVDRAKAINLAISQAGDEDIIVVAGKGHENYQLIMNQVLSFDDRIEVQKALQARHTGLPSNPSQGHDPATP